MLNFEELNLTEMTVAFLAEAGLRLLAAALIFWVGRWVARKITALAQRLMEKAELEPTLTRFLGNILNAVLLVVVVIAAISQLGVQTTSLLAVLGAAGLAVGLALQGSLSNFAAGVLIVAFRPYRVGDFIEAGGVAGTVEAVQIFTTVLKSPDNKLIVVPNSQITGGTITNFSANDTRRVDLVASCSYADDLDKVRGVLEGILAEDERVLKDPAPVVNVAKLNDSSIDFNVRPWVSSADYWPVFFSVTEQIKKRFDAAGISIPFPQRDVHVYQHGQAD